jgi:hypothetical protein
LEQKQNSDSGHTHRIKHNNTKGWENVDRCLWNG